MAGFGWINADKFFFGSPTRKRLFENFASLSVLQAAGYLLPLITLPYLVRVLGPLNFGAVAFAQAFASYFIIFTDYGFSYSATKSIAVNRDDKKKVAEIFSSVMAVKLFLGLVSAAVFSFFLIFVSKFTNDWTIYAYAFGMVPGSILFPVWFFQGMEKMKYISALNIAAKLFFTVLIFVFIKNPLDYIYVPLINSMGYIVSGLIGLWIVFNNFKVRLGFPRLTDIRQRLAEGYHIFVSMAAISLYTTSNSFILGLIAGNTAVGYYSAAEKLINAPQGLLSPVSQTIYPYLSNLASNSKEKAKKFIKKLLGLIGLASFFISLLIFIFAGHIVNLVFGDQYGPSIIVLRILAFLPFMIGLSNILGIQAMLAFGYKEKFSQIILIAGVLNIALAVGLIPRFGQNGIAVAWSLAEFFITVSMFIFLRKKRII